MAAGFDRDGKLPPASNLTFDLETGMRVAPKVGNLHYKFGHARPLGSQIIRYVRDKQTDKSNTYCPLPYGWGIITIIIIIENKYNKSL